MNTNPVQTESNVEYSQIPQKPIKTYSVGTLVYTRAALFNVFLWMLWGDFCLQMMEQVQYIIPLQLKWQGAGDKTIGFLTGSLMAIVTILLNPIIAMQSDRHRGPLGRRRPFLLWCTPLLVIGLVLLGSCEPIGRVIHNLVGSVSGNISQAALTIVLIGIFAAMFYFFNTYIMQIYQYLFADVIPQEVMGKFVGFYRAIGALSIFFFNRYLFGYTEQHTPMIYIGLAMFYGIAFILLVWQVKEGEYPPPDTLSHKQSLLSVFKVYVRECFSIPFYLKLYSIGLCFWAAYVPFMTFIVFYATSAGKPAYGSSLGMSIDAFGKIKGWTYMLQIPLFFLVGPLVDRFHPIRVVIVGLFGYCVTFLFSFVLVHDASTLLVLWLLNAAAMAVFLAAYLAMFPRLLPRAKYGQFFSANQIYFSAGLLFVPVICGWFLDVVKNYQYIFLWSGFCSLLGLWAAISVYRHWRRLGGDKSYIPPGSGSVP